ncbi:MAG: glycosyltransferase family 4 protein [Verrucomicrobiales bacterium]|nr:glycosyltransferase family 4 protein [Verrucomicrobiales bacterium]
MLKQPDHTIDSFNGQNPSEKDVNNLILVVRADPIICGHSTEARNLAEAAIARGFNSVHIVSYPIETLQASSLPLKPLDTISPYSDGIEVDRPEPIGDYKVLDGRLGYAISGQLVDLIHKLPGKTMIMDLYLVPHGQMVINAIDSFRGLKKQPNVLTVGEAVGSDITNVVTNALAAGQTGAAQIVLSNYLHHDLPVAVSQFTKDMIVDAGIKVDAEMGTDFAAQLKERVEISFPAIDTGAYTSIEEDQSRVVEVLASRGLEQDDYVMFLSRIAPAKGVDDLIAAYKSSELYGQKKLIICGNGPMKEEIQEMSATDNNIRVLDDVSDEEKGVLMYGAFAYCLPSKPMPEFIETFGIAVAEKMLAGGPGPVITTRTGGIPEATGGHCLEHEAGNVEELRECLNKAYFMTEEERKELSERARTFALNFDRVAILDNLIKRSFAVTSSAEF